MKSICVYCGSSPGGYPGCRANATGPGNEMAKRGLTLVYGGGNVGLMGVAADAALHGGSPVIGIIPKSLVCKEVGHKELTEPHIVDSVHQRKQMMTDRADASIATPGGVGTYEEPFETFTWLQFGYHNKPIGLLNVADFYDKLPVFTDHAVQEGFLKRHHANLLYVSDDPAALIDTLARALRETVDKWSECRERT